MESASLGGMDLILVEGAARTCQNKHGLREDEEIMLAASLTQDLNLNRSKLREKKKIHVADPQNLNIVVSRYIFCVTV